MVVGFHKQKQLSLAKTSTFFAKRPSFLHFSKGMGYRYTIYPAFGFPEESGQSEVYEFADSYGAHSCDLVDHSHKPGGWWMDEVVLGMIFMDLYWVPWYWVLYWHSIILWYCIGCHIGILIGLRMVLYWFRLWLILGKMGMISITTVDGINPANQLRLVVYPIIYRVLYISGGAWFLPSTVQVPPILYWRLEEKAMEGDDDVLVKRRTLEESKSHNNFLDKFGLPSKKLTYPTQKSHQLELMIFPRWDTLTSQGPGIIFSNDDFLWPSHWGWRTSAWRTTTDTFHFASRYSCSRWNRKKQQTEWYMLRESQANIEPIQVGKLYVT